MAAHCAKVKAILHAFLKVHVLLESIQFYYGQQTTTTNQSM